MLIVQDNPKSPISEAYRTLRTNIQFSNFDEKLSAIVITSPGPSEGKSTTAANLALTLAETGSKVLLIDCDLRKPSIHKKFNISNHRGLSNLLIGQYKFTDVAQKYTDKLCILTSGTIPPNPSEMLSSKKMKLFLDEAKTTFNYIILDAPPVIAVTDAQILSTMTDGVLLVIAAGQAEITEAQKAKELLEHVNANILGVVLNKAEVSKNKNYGYYHYYYGEDGKKRERHHEE